MKKYKIFKHSGFIIAAGLCLTLSASAESKYQVTDKIEIESNYISNSIEEEKYPNKVSLNIDAYINKVSKLFENVSGNIIGTANKYERVIKIFEVDNWSLIKYQGKLCYIENKNLTEINSLYNEIMKNPNRIEINEDIYFKDNTVLTSLNNDEASVSKYAKAYAYFKNNDKTLINYNGNLYYVNSNSISKIDELYKEAEKYPNRTDLECEVYFNDNAQFKKYDKAYAYFKNEDKTFIKYNDNYIYVDSNLINEIDKEYEEASKHPNKVLQDRESYITNTTNMYDSNKNNIGNIEIYQKVYEIFKDNDISLVRYDNELYYINNSDLEPLGPNYIEVDISEQNVKMYKNNELIIDGDCVTGNKKTPTNEGLFKVYEIDGPRYLYGRNGDGSTYKVYVDCFIVFDGNIGFHNVLYRTKEEHFAKDLYLKGKGSHGCVNMYKDDALKMYDEVRSSDNKGYGYKVLVHK